MSYITKLKEFKGLMKDKMPEQFHVLIDEYAPVLLDLDGELLMAWVEAVLSGGPGSKDELSESI